MGWLSALNGSSIFCLSPKAASSVGRRTAIVENRFFDLFLLLWVQPFACMYDRVPGFILCRNIPNHICIHRYGQTWYRSECVCVCERLCVCVRWHILMRSSFSNFAFHVRFFICLLSFGTKKPSELHTLHPETRKDFPP